MIDQAVANRRKAQEILALYRRRMDWIVEATRSQYAVRTLDWMFAQPIFSAHDFVEATGIPVDTARRILRILRDRELLRLVRPATARKSAVFLFPELLNLAEGSDEF